MYPVGDHQRTEAPSSDQSLKLNKDLMEKVSSSQAPGIVPSYGTRRRDGQDRLSNRV